MWSQNVPTILQFNYLFHSAFLHTGFRNEAVGRKTSTQEEERRYKNNKDKGKMTNGKLFCNINGCGKRKKYFVFTQVWKCWVLKRLNKFLHGWTSQSFSHCNVDWRYPGQDSVHISIFQIYLNTELLFHIHIIYLHIYPTTMFRRSQLGKCCAG